MASSTIEKHTIQETAAQLGHDERKGKTHKNQDINKELTSENVFFDKRNKREILDDIKDDVADIDKACPPKRKTKDRVITLEITVPYPRELAPVLPYKPTKEEENALIEKYVLSKKDSINPFFEDADEVIKKKYGKTYGACVHYDECHYYYDKSDKMYHMSRPHLHDFVTAQAEVKDHPDMKRINGKDALKRSTYKEINHLLDAPSLERCGCTFEDGRGKKSEGSVEAMKAASIRAEQDAYERLKGQNKDIRIVANATIEKLDAVEEQIAENSKILIEQEKQKNTKQEELSALDIQIADKKLEIAEKNKELFLKDKPKFLGKKRLVDDESYSKYENFYNSNTEKKVIEREKAVTQREQAVEIREHNANKIKINHQWEESAYKEKADKYDSLQSELFVSREEVNKALDDYTISNAEVISMIRQYAVFQPDSEKDALLKTCTALSKIDTYTQKSLIQRSRKLENEGNLYTEENFGFPEYESRIRDMLKKSLTYKGRTEIYQKDLLKGLWADIQKDNTSFWKSRKTPKPEAVINLDKTFTAIIPRLIQTAVHAIKTYIEMIKQAQQQQYEYDR